jgi:GNAT superfamily N-acetyltransferase
LSVPDPVKPRIEKLHRDHVVFDFDCGNAPLNRFLQAFALRNQFAGSSATYVALLGDVVAGYHSIAFSSVGYADAPERLAKGLPRHPIPAMIIARLAVDRRFQGRGIGSGLLRDAMRRGLAAAEIAGMRGVIVHAKDEAPAGFYHGFGFTPFVDKPLTLYRLLKDIRARPGR